MHKTAIIGGGPSGLTSAVAASRAGFIPTLFEISDRIGGVWGPDQRKELDHGSAWPKMRVNISRHTGTFSDFSWPKDTHDFPTTQDVYDYLCAYVKDNHIEPYFKLETKVTEVIPQGKKWLIKYQEKEGEIKEELFDSVMVTGSRFNNPHIPEFKGLDNLKGKMLHSAKYRGVDAFKRLTQWYRYCRGIGKNNSSDTFDT